MNNLELQVHITGKFRNWGDMREGLIAMLKEVNDAAKMLGPDEIENLDDPVVLDLEREDQFKVDGLIGYDLLFEPKDGESELGLGLEPEHVDTAKIVPLPL
ncbi:MAG: hypothetical protein AAF702_49665 [Chloroflexota bacterium]